MVSSFAGEGGAPVCGIGGAPALVAADPNTVHLDGLLRWLREESFVTTIAEWSWDWCLEFPKESSAFSSAEHPLQFTEAHQEYRQFFERRSQEYLQFHGLTQERFLEIAVQHLNGDAGGPDPDDPDDVYEGLIASENYATFFHYMGAVRRRREFAESTCGCSDEIDWVELVRRSLRRNLGDVTVGDDPDVEFIE